MTFLDSLRGSKHDELSQFDENEAEDLKLHVRQCARRYGALTGRLDMLIRLVIVVLVVLVLSNTLDLKSVMLKLLG